MHAWLSTLREADARSIVADLCRLNDIDVDGLCGDLAMNWAEVRALSRDPLVTIGAQSRGHWALAVLDPATARQEMTTSMARIALETGRACRHFSYPYGGNASAGAREYAMARELGLATAVTTRAGLLQPGHVDAMTALPRLTLDGAFQKTRYVSVMLSGVPFALRDLGERRWWRTAA